MVTWATAMAITAIDRPIMATGQTTAAINQTATDTEQLTVATDLSMSGKQSGAGSMYGNGDAAITLK